MSHRLISMCPSLLFAVAALLPAVEPAAPGAGAAGMPAVGTAQPTTAQSPSALVWSEAEASRWRKRVAAAGGVKPQTWLTVAGERQKISADPLQSYGTTTKLLAMQYLTPGALDVASLTIRKNGTPLVVGTDVLLDPVWGGLSLKPGGALTSQDEVELTYRLALRRLDALVQLANGREVVRTGEPDLLVPALPALAVGESLLAVIFIDHHADQHRPEVLPVLAPGLVPPATTSPERLPNSRQENQGGQTDLGALLGR